MAAGNGLGNGLRTTIEYVRRTASGAAGNGLGTTIKYLRRTRNGAAGSGLGTTTKQILQTTAAGNRNRLAATIKYLRVVAGISLGSTIKYRAQCMCVEPVLPPCVHKQNPNHNTSPFASAAQNNIPIFKKKNIPPFPPRRDCV